jgi:hypothetical protein
MTKLKFSYIIALSALIILQKASFAQDTIYNDAGLDYTLSEVIVRNNFDYKEVLKRIKEDSSFYKAFKTLRTIGYTSYNHIEMKDKNGAMQASLDSKTRQNHEGACRTMDVLEERISGNLKKSDGTYNYMTPSLYASLFFTDGKICNETNIVSGKMRKIKGSGIDKAKEQLKTLFFNPGKKIKGIPFIGDKLDLYDERAHKLYDYRLDYVTYNDQQVYIFEITAKEDLGYFSKDEIVVDKMTTWFNPRTLEVLGRNYSLSYKAGVYDFDVAMEVEMTYFNGKLVPKILRYKGNWDVAFKKREIGLFTATLLDYNSGK